MASRGEPLQPRPSAEDADARLRELRSLILGAEQSRLDAIETRLDDPAVRAEDLSRVLAEAVAARAHRDRALHFALQPILEDVLRISVARNPGLVADALYPVIGEAVRKSVARSLRALAESLNQVVERSLSLKSVAWRFEALRTGRSFGEIVLLRSLTYRVEQVFLIHRETGLLLEHVTRAEQVVDMDMVSGMLTAIQDFVQDSFTTSRSEELETMHAGEFTVWVQHGPLAMLAGVISGSPPPELRIIFQKVLEDIHRGFSGPLASFKGDLQTLTGLRPLLERCFPQRETAGGKRRSWGWAWVAGLVLLLIAAALFLTARADRRWRAVVANVERQPGIILLRQHHGWFHSELAGLRDPLAPAPEEVARHAGASMERLTLDFQPFLSLEPAFAKRRAILSDKSRIESQLIRFEVDSSHIDAAQLAPIDNVESAVRSLRADDIRPKLTIRGHADETGAEAKNLPLSLARANAVRDALIRRGIPPGLLQVEALGSAQPLRRGAEPESNRRVDLRVELGPLPSLAPGA